MGANITATQQAILARLRAQRVGTVAAPVVTPVPQTVVQPVAVPVVEALDWAMLMTQYDMMASAGDSFLKLLPGQNFVRFLMNLNGKAFYSMRMQSRIPAPPGSAEKATYVVSPRTADPNAFCPLVQVSNKMRSSTDPATKKLASDLWPSEQMLSNVLSQEPTSHRWVTSVLQYGRMIFRGLVVAIQTNIEDGDVDPNTGALSPQKNIADAVNGVAVCLTKTGEKLLTKYEVNLTSKVVPVTAEQLAARKDLAAEYCKVTPVEEINMHLCALFGVQNIDQLLADGVELRAPGAGVTQIPVPPVASVVQPVQDDDLLAVPAPEGIVPQDQVYPACVGNYGSPLPGLVCASCGLAEDCMQVTAAV